MRSFVARSTFRIKRESVDLKQLVRLNEEVKRGRVNEELYLSNFLG